MSAFIVFNYNITAPNQIDELTRLSLPVDEKYGAKLLVGSPVKTLEGKTNSHMVILAFESFKAADTYYHSDENKALTTLRNQITEGWVSILPGDSETQSLIDSGYFKS